MARPLLILTALRYEANAIAKRLGLRWIRSSVPARALGDAVELRVVGPRCAKLAEVEPPGGCRGIIMAGLAGAVDPSLRVGDVVLDERSEFAVPAVAGRRGGIHTAADVVATPAAKRAVFAATGALVADMENELARGWAERRGLPFLGVRAVSDASDAAIDPATLSWMDESGALRPGRLLAYICRRPFRIPPLLLLGARSRRAVRNLATAVSQAAASQARPIGTGPVPHQPCKGVA